MGNEQDRIDGFEDGYEPTEQDFGEPSGPARGPAEWEQPAPPQAPQTPAEAGSGRRPWRAAIWSLVLLLASVWALELGLSGNPGYAVMTPLGAAGGVIVSIAGIVFAVRRPGAPRARRGSGWLPAVSAGRSPWATLAGAACNLVLLVLHMAVFYLLWCMLKLS